VFSYIQNNAKLYGGEIGLHFHPSFRLVALRLVLKRLPVETEWDYLPLNGNTIRTEFKIRDWFEAGYATLNFTFQSE
jgi:iron complex outermembrane receptor protein